MNADSAMSRLADGNEEQKGLNTGRFDDKGFVRRGRLSFLISKRPNSAKE